MRAKVLKCVGGPRFELTLFQLETGSYQIMVYQDEKETFFEPIRDLTNAMYVFDSKFMELEGH